MRIVLIVIAIIFLYACSFYLNRRLFIIALYSSLSVVVEIIKLFFTDWRGLNPFFWRIASKTYPICMPPALSSLLSLALSSLLPFRILIHYP